MWALMVHIVLPQSDILIYRCCVRLKCLETINQVYTEYPTTFIVVVSVLRCNSI